MTNSSPAQSAAILIAKLHLRSGAENQFAAWQAKALTRAAGFKVFLNSEMTPVHGETLSWTVMLRFRDAENRDAWRNSETWRNLLGEAQTLLVEKSSIESKQGKADPMEVSSRSLSRK